MYPVPIPSGFQSAVSWEHRKAGKISAGPRLPNAGWGRASRSQPLKRRTPESNSEVTLVGQPVSRVLSGGSCGLRNESFFPPLPTWAIIYLDLPSPRGSSDRPGARGERAAPHRCAVSLLLGFAPDGGCLAAGIAAGAGGLLHHLFTLTGRIRRTFSVALSAGFPARVLPGTVLFGARTFLKHPQVLAIARPAHGAPSSYPAAAQPST